MQTADGGRRHETVTTTLSVVLGYSLTNLRRTFYAKFVTITQLPNQIGLLILAHYHPGTYEPEKGKSRNLLRKNEQQKFHLGSGNNQKFHLTFSIVTCGKLHCPCC